MLRLLATFAEVLPRLAGIVRAVPREAAVALGAAGPSTPADPKRLGRAMLIILPLALFAALLMPRITLVMTPSIEAWVVVPRPGPIKRGDYVMFTLRAPIAGPRPVQVTKHALCMPGDRLKTIETPAATRKGRTEGHHYCNGRLLGISLPVAGNGVALAHMHWSGIIPPGHLYVGSPHIKGYDSRYFGLVRLSSLTRMERIL